MSIDESLQTQQISPGKQLSAARQALGLTLDEVAQALKITSHFVRAIENDEFERLPGETFAKGYLRLYAELLSLDPEPLLASLQGLLAPQETEYKAQIIQPSAPAKGGLGKLTLALALVAIAGGGYWWWQNGAPEQVVSELASLQAQAPEAQPDTQTPPVTVIVEAPAEGLHLPADQEGASPALSLVEQLDSDLDPVKQAEVIAEVSAAAVASELLPASPSSADSENGHIGPVEIVVPAERSLGSSSPAVVEASVSEPTASEVIASQSETGGESVAVDAEPTSTEPLAALSDGLSVAFDQDCWLKVSDGQGRELFSGVKAAGSTLELDIEKPFQIRFGNAPGVGAIFYQQQPLTLDLKPGRSVAVLRVN